MENQKENLSNLMSESVNAQIEAQHIITDKFLEFLDQYANSNNELFFKEYLVNKGNTVNKIKIPYLSLINIPNFTIKNVETELKVENRGGHFNTTNSDLYDYKIKMNSERPPMNRGLSKLIDLVSESIEVTNNTELNKESVNQESVTDE
ncbi:MAG: hypothetical protein CMF62_00820 [Magnetococcales bacterium]|nr:hypothetical protein [Magnetococcales bacterium]|tara:strand:+ start:2686 stop:3132 length:447 start_codon:yes stop_codon:yes gene_type:complete